MKKFEIFSLILILAVGLFLRLYQINEIPPSLNWDEVSHGYNAYSILKTGRDEWGYKLPLIFRAYGDFKLPLYVYLAAIAEAVFGLNVFAVRLVSVLSGMGLVALAYLLTKRITRSETFSLFAAFLTAVSPWSLFLSRVAVEANLGAFLFALGFFFLLSWRDNHSPKRLLLTTVFWGLSVHTYNSARILVPIFAILMTVFIVKEKKAKQLLIFFVVMLIFWLPIVGQFLDRSGSARFGLVSLIDQGTVSKIIEKRGNSKLPKAVVRFIYNRPSFFAFYAGKNYLANFSPRYLFLRGGTHYQFSLPGHELLYLVTAPFLLLGLVKIISKGNQQEKLLGVWFLVAFIPSAITKDAPHVLRSIFVLPSPMILSALGLQLTVNFLKEKSKFGGKLLVSVLIIAVLVSFGRWWRDYQSIYPKAYSWAWQYGCKEAVEFIKENYQNYDRIYFTKRYGEPHEFVLFFFPWNPGKYQEDPNKKWDYHANWYWIDRFDKFVFVNDWEVVESVKCKEKEGRCLLITSPGNYPKNWDKIKTIDFLDGKPAFEILER